MNSVEYWILDNALEERLPFFYLDSEFDEYNVRRLWGYDREKLLDGLEAVLSRDQIAVHDGRSFITSPNRDLLIEFLDSEIKAYRNDGWVAPTYRLSSKGGNLWEKLTRPSWDHYVSEWLEFDSDEGGGVMILKASSRERIEQYLLGKETHHPTSVIRGTEEWESMSPIDITYWKELPRGQRFTCRTIYDRKKPTTGEGYRIWWDSLWEWYTPPEFKVE